MEIEISLQKAFEAALDQGRELTKQSIQQDLVIQELQRHLSIKDSLLQEQEKIIGRCVCPAGPTRDLPLPAGETHHH